MSTFTTPLTVQLIKKWEFKIFMPFQYHIGEYPAQNQENIITVPVSFITDFASIPRVIWPILSPIDEYAKAAVLHDWLYFTGIFSRKRSDEIFLEAMEVLNVPKWKRLTIYWGVRLGGYYVWWRYRKNE